MERSTSPTRPRSVRLLFFNLALALVAASIPCLAAEAVLRLLAFPSNTPGLPSTSWRNFGFTSLKKRLDRTMRTPQLMS